jgi:hypothetical protein
VDPSEPYKNHQLHLSLRRADDLTDLRVVDD